MFNTNHTIQEQMAEAGDFRFINRQICNVNSEDVATIRSNELLAQLEIDDLDVILREKRLHWFDIL